MFDFDLPTPEAVTTFQKTGGLLPVGKYHARLDGSRDVTSASGLMGTELTFIVIAGPHIGHEVKETLWQSDKEGSKNRLVLFGARLGVLVLKGGKYALAEGKCGFNDCLGADCVIEVQHEKYTNKSGKEATAVRVAFSGIWSTSDPEVKSVPKSNGTAKVASNRIATNEL